MLALLINLEMEMRKAELWENQPPPHPAFQSDLPFSCDTMTFSQWLQWVFVARFRAILEGGHSLPSECEVTPMAEEYFRELELFSEPITDLLRRIDEQFRR